MKQVLFILAFIFAGAVLTVTGCDSKPINVDLGEHGLHTDSFLTYSSDSRSIQDNSSIGSSSRLYLGKIDSTRNSYILLKINRDVIGLHNDICRLPQDSIRYSNSFIRFISTSRLTQAGETSLPDSSEFDSHFDFHLEPQLPDIKAFWMDVSSMNFSWSESSVFTFIDSATMDLGNLDLINGDMDFVDELIVSMEDFNLDISLTSASGDSANYLSELCNGTSDEYVILIRYNNPNDLLELYSSDYSILSAQPYFDVSYDKYMETQFTVNKYQITNIIPAAFNDNGWLADLDSTQSEWGSVIAMNFDLDNPPQSITPQIGVVDSPFELLSFELNLNDINADTSGYIEFYLSDIILANMDTDPNDDNFPENPDGTENNLNPDDNELFLDCGLDALCDSDEPGYLPGGTENNGLWDEGESFSDFGLDSLMSSNEPGYDPDENPDPQNDDYNIDPAGDNWKDCGPDNICPDDPNYIEPDEGEFNGEWDLGEDGDEANGQYDTGELYWDYGLDGIHDVNEPGFDEITNPDPDMDNWNEITGSGTEGNGIFDWVDVNNNGRLDGDDIFEPFMDAGTDSLWSINEPGYNSYGTEGNNIYDFGEPFEDCGSDGICNEPAGNDDYNPDPSGDNWDEVDNPEGSENNGILNWVDTNNNGLWDENEGEEWFDWGIDKIQNESEPYYGGRELSVPGTIEFVEWNYYDNPSITYESPGYDPDAGEEAVIWISSISQTETPGSYLVTLSVNTSLALHGFQLKLNHVPYSAHTSEFAESHVGLRYIDTEKLLNDFSLYKPAGFSDGTMENSLMINYGDNLKTFLDFSGLIDFQLEHPNAIISKSTLNITLDTVMTDISGSLFLNTNRLISPLLIPVDTLDMEILSNINISASTGSLIQIDIKPFIQDVSFGELEFFGLVLSASSLGNNFSTVTINNQANSDSLKPQIEILYTE